MSIYMYGYLALVSYIIIEQIIESRQKFKE